MGQSSKSIDIIFDKKKILVMGLGVTGIPVIKRLLGLGNNVTALDNNTGFDKQKLFSSIGIDAGEKLEVILREESAVSPEILDGIDLIITSPGVSAANSLFYMAGEKGVPVWDELELSWNLMDISQKVNTIAVTGTNGKTTVVNLIGTILNGAGMKNRVCGNVGAPLLDTLAIDKDRKKAFTDEVIRVVEVSSFQLERTYSFKPGIAVLLNITSDHMDRHGNLKEYARMKMKMFALQDEQDFAVLNIDDRETALRAVEITGRGRGPSVIKYSLDRKKDVDLWFENNKIFYELSSGKGDIEIGGALLRGRHNISNSEAAAAAALITGAGPESIGRSIREFKPLGHRMEYLGEVSGIRCINDSKSTNPDATIAALRDFGKEVTIIMGGLDKDMDFGPVLPSLQASARNIIIIGQSSKKMYKLFSSCLNGIEVYMSQGLDEAVEKGFEVTEAGDVLLLSPGCASMDMFRDYKDRGSRFKKEIMDRKNGS